MLKNELLIEKYVFKDIIYKGEEILW